MQVKNTLIKLVVAAAAMFPFAVSAQTSSINAFSPYTMYGIGEQNTPGTLQMRSMGGAGVAMRSVSTVNLLNPAAYSAAPQKTFLFNFGLEGQNYYNAQTVGGVGKRTAYNTFNFHDIAFQMPVAKRLGLGFSLTPYSSVGYRTKYYHEYDPEDPIYANVGNIQYNYQGEGDVTEVKVGLGWEPFKNFSVGIADRHYGRGNLHLDGGAGQLQHFEHQGAGRRAVERDSEREAHPDLRRDVRLRRRPEPGGDEKTLYRRPVQHGRQGRYDAPEAGAAPAAGRGGLLPDRQVGRRRGLCVPELGRSQLGLRDDGNQRQRGYKVAYTNTSTIKMGVEYTPNRYDARHFLKRWSYRAGFRYGAYNQTFNGDKLVQYAVTAGIGIPVRRGAFSAIDIGVEYGRRGYNIADRLGLVRQQYFKFAIGFTLFAGQMENGEYWFMRSKFD